MDQTILAHSLLTATIAEQQDLLAHSPALIDIHLAYTLKNLYDELKVSDPARANAVIPTLQLLIDHINDSRVLALTDWVAGLAAAENTEVEEAILYLDAAEGQFALSGDLHRAAQIQTDKMHALARWNQFERAITCGLRAQELFLQAGDEAAATTVVQALEKIHVQAGIPRPGASQV